LSGQSLQFTLRRKEKERDREREREKERERGRESSFRVCKRVLLLRIHKFADSSLAYESKVIINIELSYVRRRAGVGRLDKSLGGREGGREGTLLRIDVCFATRYSLLEKANRTTPVYPSKQTFSPLYTPRAYGRARARARVPLARRLLQIGARSSRLLSRLARPTS